MVNEDNPHPNELQRGDDETIEVLSSLCYLSEEDGMPYLLYVISTILATTHLYDVLVI